MCQNKIVLLGTPDIGKALNQYKVVEMVRDKYEEIIFGDRWVPKYTVEEAMQILQAILGDLYRL